jgi:hypothetical protein
MMEMGFGEVNRLSRFRQSVVLECLARSLDILLHEE